MSVTRSDLVMSANTRCMRQVELPLTPYVWAILMLPHPLTDGEWEQMLAILAVMRPALTKSALPEDGTSLDAGATPSAMGATESA
jgi:hypothetical protein